MNPLRLEQKTRWRSSRAGVDEVLRFATATFSRALEVEVRMSAAGMHMGFRDEKVIRFRLGTAPGVELPFCRPGAGVLIHGSPTWTPSEAAAVATYHEYQATLVELLGKLAKWAKLKRPEKLAVLSEIRPWTERMNVDMRASVTGEKLVRAVQYSLLSVRDVIGEALFLMLEQGMHLDGRIGRCENCKAFIAKWKKDRSICGGNCRQQLWRRRGAK